MSQLYTSDEPYYVVKTGSTMSLLTNEKPWGLACYALIPDDAGRYLLLKRSATSKTNSGRWEPPGGKLDPQERFDEAIRREVEEEAGLKIVLVSLAGAVEYDHPAVKVVCLLMRAERAEGTVQLSREHDAYVWADNSELLDLDLVEHFRRFFQRYKGIDHPIA
ncbi:MAG: NUDIX domain-containing protein [Halobacteriota archaeon]